eukprot:comp22885_c1_seq1/m.36166 comp22885_c1_seq1/g.36166  ORF comp22885_c1_seq1/g.36166 comp22885_c1_seq1/m.36166 type:complete len:363 (-) comp22885_c1_seq1:565-1653(-)
MSLNHLRVAVCQLRLGAALSQRHLATAAAASSSHHSAAGFTAALQKYRTSVSTHRPVQLEGNERDAVLTANPQQLEGSILVDAVGLLAAAKVTEANVVEQYAAAAESRLPELEPAQLSSLALSLSALNVNNPKLFVGLVEQQLGCMYKVDGPTVANTMWALAHMAYRHNSYTHTATRHVRGLMHTLSAQEVSNLAWACTTMRLYDRQLYAAMARRAIDTMHTANFQALSNLLWSFSKMKDFNFELFAAAAKICRRHASMLHPTDLARISWAFAEQKQNSKELFGKLALSAQSKMDAFNARDLVTLATAFSELPNSPKALFEGIRKRAITLWPTMDEKERNALEEIYHKLNIERPFVTAQVAN